MAPSADDVIRVAASQIGYRKTSTSSKYCDWYGVSGFWCAMFVSWCADQAGALGTVIPRHSYTPSGAEWFKSRGAWHDGAAGIRRGDVVYFDFGKGRISHVGFVESTGSDGTFETIEGNTGAPDQRSGGCVARKRRGGTNVVGYGRPAYGQPALPAPISKEDDPMFVAINKSTGMGVLIYPSGKWTFVSDGSDAAALAAAGIPTVAVTSGTFGFLTPGSQKLV